MTCWTMLYHNSQKETDIMNSAHKNYSKEYYRSMD